MNRGGCLKTGRADIICAVASPSLKVVGTAMESEESVEVEVLPPFAGSGDGKSHCSIMPSVPPVPPPALKKGKPLLRAGPSFDDAATAGTEASTDVEDSAERLSFGSGAYLMGGGGSGSRSLERSFDARVRSGQLLSVPESCAAPSVEVEFYTSPDHSLLDMDDDDERTEGNAKEGIETTHGSGEDNAKAKGGIKTTLENKLPSEVHDELHGGRNPSDLATAGSSVAYALRTESRAEFYGGGSLLPCSPSSMVGSAARNNAETRAERYERYDCGSDFAEITRTWDDNARVEFYRVSCSDAQEPLTCRQKMDQVSFVFAAAHG